MDRGWIGCGAVIVALSSELVVSDVVSCPVPINPVVADYGENVLFYMSFDDGTTQPDIGYAQGQDVNVTISDEGFFGKALASGEVRFGLNKAQEVVDFKRPGTMLTWIKTNYDPVATNRFEPNFTYFIAHWSGEWKRLLAMKKRGDLWGHGAMCFYFERSVKDRRECASATCPVRSSEWKPGVWRLFVSTWTLDKIGFSVDGNPLNVASYKTRLGAFEGRMSWIAGNGQSPFYTLDECVILDRLLTDEEIKAIYKKSLKVRETCLQQY